MLTSRTFATLVALFWAGHAVKEDQKRGLKDFYARYEANFESQSICYTYITTIAVPLESLSSSPSQELSEGIVHPATISLPPSGFDGAPALPSADGHRSLFFTSTQLSEFGDTAGLLTSATNLSPGSVTLQNPYPDPTGPSDADGLMSGADVPEFTDSALISPHSGSSSTLPDFLSDIQDPGLGSSITTSGDMFGSTNLLSDTPDSSLGAAVTRSSIVSVSTELRSETAILNSPQPPEPVPPPAPPPGSLSNTALAPEGPALSLSSESATSDATKLSSFARISDGEKTTSVSSVIPMSPAGSPIAQDDGSMISSATSSRLVTGTSLLPMPVDTNEPEGVSSRQIGEGSVQSGGSQTVTGGFSIGTPTADPAAGTTSPAGGISSGFLVSSLSTMTTKSASKTSLSGSTTSASLSGTAASSQSVMDAATLTDTSSTLDASASLASRVILSVRQEGPAFAPTVTVTEEGATSQAPPRLVRRQEDPGNSAAGFIGKDEMPNPNSCSNARLFVRSSGALRTEGQSLSVDPGVPYIDVANFTWGSLTTRFDVINGTLVWANPYFYWGQARFCQLNGSSVYATFTAAGGPQDCTNINLMVYRGTLLATYLRNWRNIN